MKYLRVLMVVGGAVGVLGGVGVGACGGAETTGATGATGSGGVAGTSSGSGMGGGSASTTESVGATGSTGTGMGVAGYDCSAPVGSVPPLKLTLVASAMDGVARPVLVKGAPGDNSRVYVLGQKGQIWIIKDGAVLPTPFLDISAIVHQPSAGDERGLLGLAFHPKYAENGRFFVYYTDKLVTPGDQHLVEYQRSAGDPDVAETKEVQTLFVQPDGEANHNGGMLEFSPKDGFLYVGMGDGGGGGDKHPGDGSPPGNGQSLATRWGKILRLDVDSATKPYGIPAGNMPGAGVTQEIWDYGLRNPWRFSFDACTSDLYIGDVGQDQWEEVDVEPAGQGKRNYGWRQIEGNHCFNPQACNLTDPQFTKPLLDYQHKKPAELPGTQGRCSIAGGYVYRGSAIPGLRGTYLFGDYCSSEIWTVTSTSPLVTDFKAGVPSTLMIPGGLVLTSFGQDNLGEIYVTAVDGRVFRIDAL